MRLLVLAALISFVQEPVGQTEEELQFPTFEPFSISGRFEYKSTDDESQLEELLVEVRAEQAIFSKCLAELLTDPELVEALSGRRDRLEGKPTAYLLPRVSFLTAIWLSLFPEYLSCLKPLWTKRTWSPLEVELALLFTQYLSVDDLGIDVEFAFGDDDKNRASIERIVECFNGLISERHYFAAMMYGFTMPADLLSGPFTGLALESPPIESFVSHLDVDETIQLRLHSLPARKQSESMQGFVNGELRWSRIICDAPGGTVRIVEFAHHEPRRLGSYGWEIDLLIHYRGENSPRPGCLYLNSAGDFLFYFLLGRR